MLLFRARVDLEGIAMKGYSAFPKAPVLLDLIIRLFIVIPRTLVGRGLTYSAEKQSGQWSSYFQILQFLRQSLDDRTELTNYYWYHRHLLVPYFSVLLESLNTYYYYYYYLIKYLNLIISSFFFFYC